jgi:hypothetical protein
MSTKILIIGACGQIGTWTNVPCRFMELKMNVPDIRKN